MALGVANRPVVYFARFERDGESFVKIGYSGNIRDRRGTLRHMLGSTTRIVAMLDGDFVTERSVLARFAEDVVPAKRYASEIFRASPALLEYIAGLPRHPMLDGLCRRKRRAVTCKLRAATDSEARQAFAAFLERNGVTYARAAKDLGVSNVAVYDWASGVKSPRSGNRRAIEIWTSGAVAPSMWPDSAARSAVVPFDPVLHAAKRRPRTAA